MIPDMRGVGRWRGGGVEALGVAACGGGEDSFCAGYGEEAVGYCEGPDLEAELGGEIGEMREGILSWRRPFCYGQECDAVGIVMFVLRAGLSCG